MHQNSSSINLESLDNLSNNLSRTYNKNFILNSTLLSIMGKLTFLRGSIYVYNSPKDCFELKDSKGRCEVANFKKKELFSISYEKFDW